MIGDTITAGGLTMLLVELIKWIWRKFIIKDMSYDFPVAFYAISLPVLNALMPFVLVLMGISVTDPILTLDFLGVIRFIVQIIVASLISLFGYNQGVKPLKTYSQELKLK